MAGWNKYNILLSGIRLKQNKDNSAPRARIQYDLQFGQVTSIYCSQATIILHANFFLSISNQKCRYLTDINHQRTDAKSN